jgi:hypothetical protein
MKKKHVFQNLLLVIVSLSVSLLLGELLVRLILPQDKMVTWLEMHPDGFMMNQSGGNAFQEHGERRADYRFSNTRLRGVYESERKKEILALGDSFTFGLLLNEEDTYIHHLNEKLAQKDSANARILNGGVGGAGLADWPAWLENFGNEVEPDVVLYFMHASDLERALSKNIYVLESDSLIKSQRWKPRLGMQKIGQKDWYRWLQAKSELFNILVKLLWKNVYFTDLTNSLDKESSSVLVPELKDFYLESDYSLHLGKAIIQKMSRWCEESGCELVVTTTGFFPQADAEESAHTLRLYNELKNDSTGFSDQLNFFDISECVSSRIDGDYNSIKIPGDSHPNEQGAKIISDCSWMGLENYLSN